MSGLGGDDTITGAERHRHAHRAHARRRRRQRHAARRRRRRHPARRQRQRPRRRQHRRRPGRCSAPATTASSGIPATAATPSKARAATTRSTSTAPTPASRSTSPPTAAAIRLHPRRRRDHDGRRRHRARVDVRALGSADTITVNDLAGTGVKSVDVDLSAIGGGGDGAADTVVVNGTDQARRRPGDARPARRCPSTGLAGSDVRDRRQRGALATRSGVKTLGGNDDVTRRTRTSSR